MTSARARRAVLALALGMACWFAADRPASAAMTEKQVREKVAAAYGVRVLKARRGTVDGVAVFLVTVMNPGGDFNEAFQVTTLAVDVNDGRLVRGFRHRPSGLSANQAPRYDTNRQTVDGLTRGLIWR